MPPPASDTRSAGKIVFVGNIPYGLTEEQITEIFSSAGRVVSFRLVYDRETGRPKGFGFAEYSDPETAASAVRNLDNYEIMGRKLRVDFSHEGNAPDDVDTNSYSQQQQSTPTNSSILPQLPPGTDLPAGIGAPDAISETIKAIPAPQLLEILGQMKTLVAQDPLKATELLRQAPQLSYAILQALLLMNLVDPSVLTTVIESAGGTAAAPVAQPQPPPQQYYATPPPQAVAPTPQPPQVQDPQRAQLLQSVMQLTSEQIAALPIEQQQQIMYLKQSLMAGGGM